MKKGRGISKKEAITAYVLHIMMWDELSKSGKETKNGVKAIKDHKAFTCEFCNIDNIVAHTYDTDDYFSACRNCPAGTSLSELKKGCLGGLFNEWWNRKASKEERKVAAAKIRDVKLAPWFKELIS